METCSTKFAATLEILYIALQRMILFAFSLHLRFLGVYFGNGNFLLCIFRQSYKSKNYCPATVILLMTPRLLVFKRLNYFKCLNNDHFYKDVLLVFAASKLTFRLATLSPESRFHLANPESQWLERNSISHFCSIATLWNKYLQSKLLTNRQLRHAQGL